DDPPGGKADPDLAHFSIEPNRAFLLPVLKSALEVNPQLHIVASPWSPPGWMKTSGSMVGGRLRPEAQPALANYLVRFVDAFAAEGVPIFALTLQNEPGFEPGNYPGMKLDPQERAAIIGRYLGPTLAQRPAAPLILDWDPKWAVSLHWFTSKLIIGSTRGWARGVVLWNLALDESHGPHAGGCTDCRGVVTIDSATGAVTRNVEYYVLGHASRFVRPGAHRIESTTGVKGLESVAFQNADDGSL